MSNAISGRKIALFFLLITVIFACVAGYYLLSKSRSADALDRTMAALARHDRAAIAKELTLLEQRDSDTGTELARAALMLNDQQPAESLSKLADLKVDGDLETHHALLTAAALIDLDRHNEAEEQIELARTIDPDNLFAARQMQQLEDAGYFEEKRQKRFVTQMKPVVETFCGDCHTTPLPSSFPKSKWAKEVSLGFKFYKLFDRHDLDVPDHDNVLDYFRILAPEGFEESQLNEKPVMCTAFRKQPEARTIPNPGVAHISWGPLQTGTAPVAIITDMRYGTILAANPNKPKQEPQLLGKLNHPCHTTKCDLDSDGDTDLLVADLGSFYPKDHRQGRVVCLRSDGQGNYETVVLLENVGRVADVQPGDFDGDGDQDLIAAEFGWRTSGRILFLENVGQGELEFDVREIDSRHGTIHVPVVDIDLDGNLDFVALISQEHEKVVAFLGDGDGGFSPKTIFSANDPSFGSSGIELIDLDQDNDLDILYTNGDSFDSDLMKPYHGVQWLENQGDLKFASHRLADCYGAYRARPVDFDQDGDLDVVVVTALPTKGLSESIINKTNSILCLINDGHQNFEKQTIEQGNCLHMTCDVGDFDGDGDVDLITGVMNVFDSDIKLPVYDVWLNQTAKPAANE